MGASSSTPNALVLIFHAQSKKLPLFVLVSFVVAGVVFASPPVDAAAATAAFADAAGAAAVINTRAVRTADSEPAAAMQAWIEAYEETNLWGRGDEGLGIKERG